MLYDGAIRFLRRGIEAIESSDIEAKAAASDRALAIVQHLHLSLDMDRGQEISANLERLYSFVITQITEGSSGLQPRKLEEAIKVLGACRELAPSKQESTTYEPSLVCKLLILGCRLLIPDRLLDTLRSAWAEVAQQERAESVPTELLAQQAANGRLAVHG